MARLKKPKYDELYGEYPKLSENEKEYIRIMSDPSIKIRELKNTEIAEILGLDAKTLYIYRQKPEVREAINKETMLKAAEDLGDMVWDLRDMALGKGDYKDITANTQFNCKKLWLTMMGFIDEAKQKHVETRRDVKRTGEQKLRELAKEFRGSLVQPKK